VVCGSYLLRPSNLRVLTLRTLEHGQLRKVATRLEHTSDSIEIEINIYLQLTLGREMSSDATCAKLKFSRQYDVQADHHICAARTFSHLDNGLAPVRLLQLKESSVVIVSTLGRQAFATEPQNSCHRNCQTMETMQQARVSV
jgi:hypothetical protein